MAKVMCVALRRRRTIARSLLDPVGQDLVENRRQFVEAFNRSKSGVRAGATAGSHATGTSTARRSGTGGSSSGTAPTGSTGARGMALDQAFVDQITGRLAIYQGRSRRSSRSGRPTRDAPEFVKRVARIGTQDRAAFLREVGFGAG